MGMIFAIGAGLCCLLMGLRAGALLGQRQRRLLYWQLALQRLAAALDDLCSLPEALRRGETEIFRAMADRLEAEPLLSLGEAWEQCAGEEKTLLREMFFDLDRGDLDRRRMAAAQAEEKLAREARLAGERAEKDRPLYRSLGAFGGLALIMLLL